MTTVQVFDPAMCCDTGICGPTVDPKLVRFAADLDWLKGQGIAVQRFNLSQQPGAFAGDGMVKSALEEKGTDALPLVKTDGKVSSVGRYPTREELAGWAGVAITAPTASIYTDAVGALVGLSAAVASNCEACFKVFHDKARQLGVPDEDIIRAIKTAEKVKAAPPRRLSELIERTLNGESHGSNGVGADSPAHEAAPSKTGACC